MKLEVCRRSGLSFFRDNSPLPTEALKISRHLRTQRQIASIEPLDLLDAGPSVLGEVEDIDLSVAEDDPHTNCRMA